MARYRKTAAGMESIESLARKAEILERELAQQREAIERLTRRAGPRQHAPEAATPPVRKSA